MALCQVLSVLLQFLGSVVLARHVTPEEMGIYAVAAAAVGLLALIQAFGLQSLIVREEVLTEGLVRTAFTVNLVLNLVLVVGTAALGYVGGRALGDERVRTVILALALTPLFGILDFLPSAQLERAGRFKALSIAGVVSGAMGAVVTATSAVAGARYMTAVYAGWASAGTYAALVNIVGRRHVRLGLGVEQWRRTANFGLQVFLTSGMHAIGGRLSDIALGRLQGLAALGVYNRAGSLNGLLWNNVHLAIGRVMLVDFADLHRQGRSLRERYIATVDVITALLWPAFAGLAILAGPLIEVIYGERWTSAALPMSLLALASIVSVSITMTWEVFTATGNLAVQTRMEFYNAVIGTLAFIAGGWFGILGAAASRVVSAALAVLVYRRHLNRMTDTRSSDFVGVYARSAGLTLLSSLPPLALMLAYGFSPKAPLGLVLASVVAGLVFWSVGVVVLRHRILGEVSDVLARLGRNLSAGRPRPAPGSLDASGRIL